MFCASEVSTVPSHAVLTVVASLLVLTSTQLAVLKRSASYDSVVGAMCYYCVAVLVLFLATNKVMIVVTSGIVAAFALVSGLPKAHEGVASTSLALPLVSVTLAGLVHSPYAALIAVEITSLSTLLIVVTTPNSVNKACLLSYYWVGAVCAVLFSLTCALTAAPLSVFAPNHHTLLTTVLLLAVGAKLGAMPLGV